jgi:hypothetical protein
MVLGKCGEPGTKKHMLNMPALKISFPDEKFN